VLERQGLVLVDRVKMRGEQMISWDPSKSFSDTLGSVTIEGAGKKR
jgi:hypothetical protein